jgi:uncharacterized membrane protein YbhN (UPF0104 family)
MWLTIAGIGTLCAALILSDWVAERLSGVLKRVFRSGKSPARKHLLNGWSDLHRMLHGHRTGIALFSVGLWLVHLTQIWMFTETLSLDVGFSTCLGLFPFVMLAGQLPFTFAGIGARDVAIVTLLAGRVTPEAAAAIGVLIALRGLLPSLAAVPFLRVYVNAVLEDATRWRRG